LSTYLTSETESIVDAAIDTSRLDRPIDPHSWATVLIDNPRRYGRYGVFTPVRDGDAVTLNLALNFASPVREK
jgi:hypothetical protein